jgi:aminopeptidase N
MMLSVSALAQMPPIEPGVSQELAKWRAARYSNVRYKLNLTLEKMSPVLKGTMEIRVNVGTRTPSSASDVPLIILDWRKIKGHEEKSTVANVSINGKRAVVSPPQAATADEGVRVPYDNEHLIFSDGVVMGENVIRLDFTSPILTSGSAITRYVDKEDGSEYLYSLFVPSDASTAFPVFDQPDIKARFWLRMRVPEDWTAVSNQTRLVEPMPVFDLEKMPLGQRAHWFLETKPISTYVFAFAAGPWERVSSPHVSKGSGNESGARKTQEPSLTVGLPTPEGSIYLRKSQVAKFKPYAAEVFRLNREAVKYFEEYFDYKFPWPKYDLVLIPEFPFGGMEHAGATFLREASIIFPQEPTRNDHISRATLIFHEAAHQWFGDTVTMRWFDDLWLKEGFATFTAYKALEKIMPEMNAWKIFYERVKQAAYQTDSTRGTTAIYQPIANLSAAKSAYGNIVYNKSPAFLRQSEFYLGEDKFQAAVRAFLKKHEFGNAGWEDLVAEFVRQGAARIDGVEKDVGQYSNLWVNKRGLKTIRISFRAEPGSRVTPHRLNHASTTLFVGLEPLSMEFQVLVFYADGSRGTEKVDLNSGLSSITPIHSLKKEPVAVIPNYGDYGYGIFLIDEKSRDYVLKNIQNEKDPFLRSMMWGALWDSVREGELDPRKYVELVVRILMHKPDREGGRNSQVESTALTNVRASAIEDESTTALLLNRVGTAMNYYIDERPVVGGTPTAPVGRATGGTLAASVEEMLIAGMRNAETLGQRITYYRAFLNIASSENARGVLKKILNLKFEIRDLKLKTKDKFDIVTKLLVLNDPEAPGLLAELEKTETSDDAKRYAYAAKAGIPTAENKAKYWNDFVNNKEISESWIEAAFGPWNSIRHSELTLPYLERALKELPNHKRNRKIFFVNGWLGAFIGGQRSEEALAVVNKFLADNPKLDNDLRLKILENEDVIERAVRIRKKY